MQRSQFHRLQISWESGICLKPGSMIGHIRAAGTAERRSRQGSLGDPGTRRSVSPKHFPEDSQRGWPSARRLISSGHTRREVQRELVFACM